MLEAFDRIDVRGIASQVRAPTLVLHAKGDLRVPFAEGRLIATTIPGARFVPLDSRNHLLLEGEPAWPRFLSTVREFLGVPSERSGVRLPLTPERRRQVEELFDDVADLAPEARAAALSRASSGDPTLRREVEALLADRDDAAMTSALAGLVSQVMRRREQESEHPGETVGSYEIREQLGSGGMGVVFRALDRRLNRPVALKFLPASVGADAQLRQRFFQEAKAAASLDHSNICTIYGVEQAPDGRLFLVMPYYEGETLQGRIRRGPLPVAEALDYARQLAAGLGHAHAAGIVHRDIKPANVAITRSGQVKILDFGIAKMADASLTRTGMVLGTLAYMSPEQAAGEKQVDHRTDLWALGVVLYEMLAGRRPFGAGYHRRAFPCGAGARPRAAHPAQAGGLTRAPAAGHATAAEAARPALPGSRPRSWRRSTPWSRSGPGDLGHTGEFGPGGGRSGVMAPSYGNARTPRLARSRSAPGRPPRTTHREEYPDGHTSGQDAQAGAGGRGQALHGDDLARGGEDRAQGWPQRARDHLACAAERRCRAEPGPQRIGGRLQRLRPGATGPVRHPLAHRRPRVSGVKPASPMGGAPWGIIPGRLDARNPGDHTFVDL